MESIRGRAPQALDSIELAERVKDYQRIHLDLGTGDGRYVRTLAVRHPDWFVIGIDACRENLREHSQAQLSNMLFLIAPAQDLPRELSRLADRVSINFPWGSLLASLLAGDPRLLGPLRLIARSDAGINIRLNGGALAEAGRDLESGVEEILGNMRRSGWYMDAPTWMDAAALRNFPSRWAKRLAYGRDPRAMALNGRLVW